MMAGPPISAKAEITGEQEVKAAMDSFARRAGDLTATHRLIASQLISGVASRTPVLTGTLRGSWRALGSPAAADITSDVSYAGPVEYGVPGRSLPVGMVAATIAASEAEILATYDRELARIAREEGFELR
jgi:hypothetical protein